MLRCCKCLCRGHQLKDCKGQRNCSNCGGRHHQSICLRVFRESQPTDSKIKNEEATIWGSATTIATTSTKKAKGSILLQTVIATKADRSKSVPVRILFDNGSQRSYVTKHIKAKLSLIATSPETLHLKRVVKTPIVNKNAKLFLRHY